MTFRDLLCLAWVALAVTSSTAPAEPAFDLVFAGGRVVDGTGAPWFRADVGVRGDRIAAVGDLTGSAALRRVDARGLVISPGFIDMLGQSEYFLLVDNRAASKITQGITTEITGEGQSIAPLDDRMVEEHRVLWQKYGLTPHWRTLAGYFEALERARPAVNLGTFVGAGGIRDLIVGREDRPATADELSKMEAAVAQAMEEGALGLSTSLQYVPDRFASTEEIIALAKVAARYGGSYITHQRSESYAIDSSLDEVFRVAREAAIPAQIYHLKTACRENWGRMRSVLERLEKARAEGLDVSANQYPWTAGANNLSANLPLWMREGGQEKMLERLADPVARARAKKDIATPDPSWENQYLCAGGPSGILIGSVVNPELKKYVGRTLEQIATEESKDPLDVLMDLLVADGGETGNIVFIMHEDDVRTALGHPLVGFCTDSPAGATDGPLADTGSHPRGWGSAPRILGRYVRDEKLLSLEEAIRKMTSLPASRMSLADRGILKPGMAADIVAFDPSTIMDRATYQEPHRHSAGVRFVAVNGELVLDDGRLTEARPGRLIRGHGYRSTR